MTVILISVAVGALIGWGAHALRRESKTQERIADAYRMGIHAHLDAARRAHPSTGHHPGENVLPFRRPVA